MTCAGLASSLRSRMPVTPVQLRIRGEPAVLMRMPEASVDEDRNFSPLVRDPVSREDRAHSSET
jgi:hypothetical protein